MSIRPGVKWSDGQTMTAQDVKYSFDLAKIATHPQHPLWADTGLKSTKVSGNDVIFTFAGKPGYQQFDFYRYNVAIVPQHVFKSYTNTDIASGNLGDTSKLIGTGPYVYQSGVGASSTTVVWKKRGDWWATNALGKSVGPTYVVDIKNGTNAAALSNLLAGNIDLFNNFAPKNAIKGKFKTYFDKAPYHLGANTTWLFPNTTKAPLNDRAFRRALATSINMNQILDKAYQGLVNKASPTGLLPIWNKWIDTTVVKQWGFSYNVGKAKSILAAAGYKDTNGDGYVENKDGSPIDLSIVCPNGWSDWMTSIQVIADSAKAAGIKITPSYPGVRDDGRRPWPRELRPAARQRPAVLEHAVDVLPVHLPAADHEEPDDGQLRALLEPDRLEPHEAAGQDSLDQHQGLPGSDVEAAEDVPAGSSGNSALVQRHVVDGQHGVLDGLAVIDRKAVHALLLAELLADDEHRHAHQHPPREHLDAERRTVIAQHPSRLRPGGVLPFRVTLCQRESR